MTLYKKNAEERGLVWDWLRPLLLPVVGSVIGYLILFSRVESRVAAIEGRNEKVDPLVERFIQLEERDLQLVGDVAELKNDMKYLIQIHLERFGGSPQN